MPEIILPPLRQDLMLKQMEPDEDGFPTWVIYDKAGHHYYLIGWLEFEILARWQLGSSNNIVKNVNTETTLKITEKNVDVLLRFLATHDLLQINDTAGVKRLLEKQPKRNWGKHLVTSYLFFLIPLFNPDRFLDKTIKYIRPLFSKVTVVILAIIAVSGFYLIIKQWDAYIGTFNYLFEFSNLIVFGLIVIFVKIVHELGHAYTAKYFGCHVSTIGVAFIILWPVMYTDTTDVWKLTKKYQRAAVAAAGMCAELAITIIAIFLWSFVPEGLPKYILFFISTVSIAHSLFINLNPMMRFDGYYLFSDLVNVSNLQSTAFPIARWKLREWLFKFGEEPPIIYPKKKETLLLAYSYFTWIYRFFLFLGIAFLVYYFFFKALGIILMLIEVIYFIFLPIAEELKNYWDRRKHITMNKHSIITFSILGFLLLIFIVPWNTTVKGPATLEYTQQTKLYTAFSGEIQKINFVSGELVSKGQLLMSFNNYNLDYALKDSTIAINSIKLALDQQINLPDNLKYQQASLQDLRSKENDLQNFLDEKTKLTIYAPFSGIIFSNNPGFYPSVWLDKDTLIGDLVNPEDPVVYAFVAEKDLERIQTGATAIFYPEQVGADKVKLKVVSIDPAATDELQSPYLASTYGGKIAVIPNKENNKLEIQQAIYRVKLVPTNNISALYHVVTGEVQIKGKRESYASQLFRLISATLIRESGF